MMNHFMVLVVLLSSMTCSATYSEKESFVFPVTYVNISKDLVLQQLLVEWDVDKSAREAELAMSFEIQVHRTDVAITVWTEFLNVTLDKSGKPLHWVWDSDFPLECMSHSVRIRSRAEVSNIWSQWSLWKTVLGLDTSNNHGPQIFPNEKIVEEGSDISFCCIGREGQIVKDFFLVPTIPAFNHTNGRLGLLTVKNVTHHDSPHIMVYCQESCNEMQCYDHAGFFVGKPPDTPHDFSCQTQDTRTVTCTWSPGGDTHLYGRHSPKYVLSDEFSQNPILCTVSCSEQCSCSWDIEQQKICNITLTVENPLGKKTATDSFDVTHRIYPTAPFQLWEECTDTEITLYWKLQNIGIELFCQTEVLQPNGKVEVHNSSAGQLSYGSVTLRGLQPYTEYTARVHCGAAQDFWRWSEWSEAQTIRTKEAAPSGTLDIWREIKPVLGGRNVTLFWKQAPEFQANGKIISYEVTWRKVEDASEPESISLLSVYNSTRIFIDSHSYRISIVAKNNVNYSLPSVLIIPTGTEEDRSGSELEEEWVNGTDDGIFISWEPRHIYDSYIIDWCNVPALRPCDFQWKSFGANASSALISSAAFVPGVRYNFHIYGSVANRATLLEKKTGYFKELPPLFDPVVENIELTFNAVTLYWDSYPTNESQPGFLRGYHVYVSPLQEDCSLEGSKKHVLPDNSVLCKYSIDNPEEKRYTVKHLLSNTKYKLVVKAYTGGGENPIVNFRYIDTPFNLNILYLLILLVIIPTLAAAICLWKIKWVQECCCPVIPHPNKSRVLSFKEFNIGSEKVLKISDCIPDMLVVDSKAEAQKLHPWSPLSSTSTAEKIDGHSSSWIYAKENEERDFTPTPQTHTWFANFAYSSHLAVDSDSYQIPETLEASKPKLSLVLYQPHYYDIFNEDAASTPRETSGRKASLKYISQTPVHCLGRRL
ncbi:oncostatin-M-specific receptor subunit beta [Calypte anna]|uniref:oncostatin-M-specific receptor subunit beta n=1 Tax=Calypte anna TaxID=9244 RepID=UPI0011C3D805|nr:oncostatin-M-specific receptor subunit beta [Calypte anna]XP_030323794.1 oncostatin-M-specific receptor subunit beta [Calypte anna]XP_030323795.1 oncostatin-M-specific receptor subunit beta [Calypte anna]